MPLRRPRSPRPLVLLPGHSRQVVHEHTPEQSSYLIFPPSPTSLCAVPRTPITPPPRLHLRIVLPSPPLSPEFLNSAPEVPYPWIWRCHKCGQIYRLGVTRRCLHDGHLFCSVPQRPETPVTDDEDQSSNGSSAEKVLSAEEQQMRNARRRRQKAKRRRRPAGCSAEFDYSGWAQYNSWRRYTKIYKLEKAAALRRQNGGREENGDEEMHIEYATQNNCWNDCEFPSECHNTRLEEEHKRRQIQALLASSELVPEESSDTEVRSSISEEEESFNFQGKVMEIEEWEAELQRQKVAEFERQEREMEEMEKFAVAVYGSEPPSLSSSSDASSSSTFGADEMDIVDMERRGLEGEAQMVDVGLGPISSSELELEDGEIYGSEFASRHRKKSIQKIAQLTGLMLGVEPVEMGYEEEKLRSPLKEGHTFDETWDEIMLVDKQIEDEERSGSMYRRRVGRGEVGEFGDEDEHDL